MTRTRVVVLSTPSLFTEGIAARLRQHLDQVDLHVVNSQDDDAVARTLAIEPDVILFEAQDGNVECACPLIDLLAAAPLVRVIRLDVGNEQVRLLTSEQKAVSEPMDLISMVLTPA